LALREELVAVLDNLVSTADEVHVVFLEESRHDIRPEGERDTTIVFAPAGDILVGIRPQQVAEKTAVGDLSNIVLVMEGKRNEGVRWYIHQSGA